MYLDILPRRVNGQVDVELINEMSVLLPEVPINDYTETGLFVQFRMDVWYTINPPPDSDPFSTFVEADLDPTPPHGTGTTS